MRCVGILQIIFSFLAIDAAGVRASPAYHSNLKILNENTPGGRLSALQKFHTVYTPLVVTMMHEPLKAHPKAARRRHHRHRLKRPVIVIARAQ
jgi:hypothetical protein